MANNFGLIENFIKDYLKDDSKFTIAGYMVSNITTDFATMHVEIIFNFEDFYKKYKEDLEC